MDLSNLPQLDVETTKDMVDLAVEKTTVYGMEVLGAVTILLVGLWISKRVGSLIERAMRKTGKIDEMLVRFVSSLARYGVMLFTIVAVLAQFGVQTASLVAVLGAAGLAVGLALQGTLSHVASGVMLLIFRPFKIGDYVEVAGFGGSVFAVGLFTTELKTPDNIHIIIPNGKVWDSSVKNYSHNTTRRVDLVMGISYEDDINKAMKVMQKTIDKDERVLKDQDVVIAVNELADSSVNFVVRMWCASSDYWKLRWDMTKALKEAFDANDISIPYPQRDVHMITKK